MLKWEVALAVFEDILKELDTRKGVQLFKLVGWTIP